MHQTDSEEYDEKGQLSFFKILEKPAEQNFYPKDTFGMKINEEAIKIFFKKADEVFANQDIDSNLKE